jgi:hypothetical protein
VAVAVLVFIGVISWHVLLSPSARHNSPVNESAAMLRGVSLSPVTYNATGFNAFFTKANGLDAVEWQGDWQELGQAGTGASLVTGSASEYHYTPILVVSAFKDAGQSRSVPIRPLTPDQVDAYVSKAEAYARDHRPAYFGVGVEVNRIHETSPTDYSAFVSLFHKAASAIHRVSPGTKVFTTFQLERLKGLRGGLYGGNNDPTKNDWALLDDFSDADFVGFTSYPELIYKTPADLPSGYYSDVASHTSKPVVFTELGWPAATVAAGWDGSTGAQVGFLNGFKSQTASLPVQFVIWSFLYDQQTSAPFTHLGLLNDDGSERPARQAFQDL